MFLERLAFYFMCEMEAWTQPDNDSAQALIRKAFSSGDISYQRVVALAFLLCILPSRQVLGGSLLVALPHGGSAVTAFCAELWNVPAMKYTSYLLDCNY